jgi:hypothetical protein
VVVVATVVVVVVVVIVDCATPPVPRGLVTTVGPPLGIETEGATVMTGAMVVADVTDVGVVVSIVTDPADTEVTGPVFCASSRTLLAST